MSTPEIPGTPGEQHHPERRKVTVRRAPKFVPFLVLGGLLGFAVAAFLAYGVPGDESYDASSVFGFFLILCGAGGVILGGIAALVLDRLSVRRAERAVVESVPDSAPDTEDQQ
ncbi:MAG: hypothetical protein ABWX85_09685 [Arthrobacter sp.]